MFTELLAFLSHQNADYITTVKHLEKIVDSDDNVELIQLMLYEAYLGIKVHDFSKLKDRIESIKAGDLDQVRMMLQSDQLTDEEIKAETERLIGDFEEHPKQVGARLVLFQELCLDRGILPNANVLDIDEEI